MQECQVRLGGRATGHGKIMAEPWMVGWFPGVRGRSDAVESVAGDAGWAAGGGSSGNQVWGGQTELRVREWVPEGPGR